MTGFKINPKIQSNMYTVIFYYKSIPIDTHALEWIIQKLQNVIEQIIINRQ